jgi:23S rRNA (guanosine2251-2'-O)-methyltransferase
VPRRAERSGEADDLVAGRRSVLELLKGDQPVVRVLLAKESAGSRPLVEVNERATEAGVPVRVVPRSEIDRAADGLNHQGVIAIVGRYRYVPLEQLLAGDEALVLFLDGITDPHNLGSLLRSADGAGFDGVVVPTHRSAGVTATVRKVAVGAAEIVPVSRVGSLGVALEQAKQAGLWVVGLDERADEGLWTSELLEAPLALVLGAEGRGLSKGVRDRCDGFVKIPSRGRLASLNVGVAGALAMFELARRRSASATL